MPLTLCMYKPKPSHCVKMETLTEDPIEDPSSNEDAIEDLVHRRKERSKKCVLRVEKKMMPPSTFWEHWGFAVVGLVVVFFLLIIIIVVMALVIPSRRNGNIASTSERRSFVIVTAPPSQLSSRPPSPSISDEIRLPSDSQDTEAVPSGTPTVKVTSKPSTIPTHEPTRNPSGSPVTPTKNPTPNPTGRPTAKPIATKSPTQRPSVPPIPTTRSPTSKPVDNPSDFVSPNSESGSGKTIFYAIGDVPYNQQQVVGLRQQILELPSNAEFLVHVGDIRSAVTGLPCVAEDYRLVDDILRRSEVPVFIVPGDNEWNDCTNIDAGWKLFNNTFVGYESKHWTHSFDVVRQPGRPENFAFVHKGSLFLGLNLVGGAVHDRNEWYDRLTSQAQWTIEQISRHQLPTVVFGHANPSISHNPYFVTIRTFIQNELENRIPILYVNGDKHQWSYDRSFFSQQSWTRIMLTGGVSEPPLMISVDPLDDLPFRYDRQL